jgi:hypothetical protein
VRSWTATVAREVRNSWKTSQKPDEKRETITAFGREKQLESQKV